MAARRTNATTRPSPALQALLGLSGLAARAKQGGIFSEALTLVFEGSSLQRGAVYESSADGLELVAEEGLPPTLRAFLRAFPSSEAPWCAIQAAAKKRRLAVETDVAAAAAMRIDPTVVEAAGWSAMAAAPMMVGREVLGVLVLAAPSADLFTADGLAVLETAANILGLSLARERALTSAKAEEAPGERRAPTEAKLARLAILGSLAAGFADELRWPLSSLGSQLDEQDKLIESLRQRYPGVSGAFDDLSRIQDEATAALRFARTAGTRLLLAIEDAPAEPIDIGDLAHEAAALVEPTARAKGVDLLVSSGHDADAVVIGKRSDLGQIMLALLMNGIEACAAAPRALGKDGKEPEKPLVCLSVSREASKVVLRVEDTGPGIPPDVKPRIFDPFFSTKKDGIGLGLTLSRQVALAHAGSIELDRSELGGAQVRVVLFAAPSGTEVVRANTAPLSRRKPLSMPEPITASEPAESEAPPHTARDGWTSAPTPIKAPSKRPVRAPQPLPGSQRVGRIIRESDSCAPTQRVPRTPATGSPAVPLPVTVRISNPTPTPNTAGQVVAHVVTPKVDVIEYSANTSSAASSGKAAPTARVPEAPRRAAPKSRRGK